MRALLLTLALAACGSSAARAPVEHVAPADEGVRITVAPPAVGDRRTVTSIARFDADTRFPDGSARHIVVDDEVTAEIDVLEVAAGHEQKVRVRYPVARVTRTMGEIRSKEDKRFAGKTYIVGLAGGELGAVHEDGSALRSLEEVDLLEEWDEDLGRADPLLALVAAGTWTPGEKRDLQAKELATVHFGDDSVQLRSGTIMLRDASADLATFELDVVMIGREAEDTIEMPARISLELQRRTGRPMSLRLAGRMTGASEGMQVDGAVEMTQRWTYP